MIGPDRLREPDTLFGVERRSGAVEETEPVPLIPTSPLRRRKCSKKARGLRVSDKNNLTLPEINVVAHLLISQDAISYFLCHCHSIYEGWMQYRARQPLDSGETVAASVVAAFDTVQDLLDGSRICRLLLRFAYFQLTQVIDAYKAVAATNRVQHKARRDVGHGDASVAIDLYLEKKRKVSGVALKRSRLLGYCRTGRRWANLVGRADIGLSANCGHDCVRPSVSSPD